MLSVSSFSSLGKVDKDWKLLWSRISVFKLGNASNPVALLLHVMLYKRSCKGLLYLVKREVYFSDGASFGLACKSELFTFANISEVSLSLDNFARRHHFYNKRNLKIIL